MARQQHPDKTPPDTPNSKLEPVAGEPSRRLFLRWSALTGAGASLGAISRVATAAEPQATLASVSAAMDTEGLTEASIAALQERMAAGELSSRRLVRFYLRRIRKLDRVANCVLEVNPDAVDIARELDRERRRKGPRGPLHGIPVLLKDNIDTADSMMTTAGSLALAGAPALQDATVAARLREAGAVILGKANLSEWANFRGFGSSSGWSGVGGQCNNPYVLDRNPCGSSSGSAASVSANFCAAALGTETDGSVVCPASACGVVGIKPTVGLSSRAGVVPISATQDTVGVHARTVADAAAMLGPLTGVDPRDPATAASEGNSFPDYSRFVDQSGLQGTRIGVARQFLPATQETDAIFEQALQAMSDAGAELVDPVDIPTFDALNNDQAETIVLVFEFKRDLNAYLATRSGVPVTTLADVIQFNQDNFDAELKFFGQELMEQSEADTFSEAEYLDALERGPRLAGPEGIDAALAANNLDALVAPTGTPAWPNDIITGDCFQFGSSSFAAVAGYPLITVPAGFAFGLPVGITLMAGAWSEPTLIKLASGFEAATQVRQPPRFLPTFDPSVPGTGAARRGGARKQEAPAPSERFKQAVRRPNYL